MKLNFIVDKEKNFVYFLKSMSSFENISYSVKFKKYFEDKFGKLSEDDIKIIKEFDDFLILSSKKIEKVNDFVNINYSSKILWNFYSDNKFNFSDEYFNNILVKAKNLFGSRFDSLWEEEFIKINKWNHLLSNYNFDNFDNFLDLTSYFFDINKINNDHIININLMIGISENSTYSFSNKGVDNFINIGLSNTNIDNYTFVIGVIMHEIIHSNFESNSTTYNKLILDFSNNYLKNKINGLNIKFYYQFTESIINTVASSLFIYSYIGDYFLKKEYLKNNSDFNFFDYKNRFTEKDIQYYVFKTSEEILSITTQYIKNKKKVDNNYFTFVYDKFYNNLKLLSYKSF